MLTRLQYYLFKLQKNQTSQPRNTIHRSSLKILVEEKLRFFFKQIYLSGLCRAGPEQRFLKLHFLSSERTLESRPNFDTLHEKGKQYS
jgi:hypothetical protein